MKIYLDFAYRTVTDFDKTLNGIQLVETAEQIKIFCDIFRTVPLFVASGRAGDLHVFSDFQKVNTIEDLDKSVDKVGFWEILLFANGIGTRTLYESVKQVPASTCLTIDKDRNTFRFEKTWNYDVREDSSIRTIEQAADGLIERLDEVFSMFSNDQEYLMGLSGGMDSRLTLAMLARYVEPAKLKLFTYGFNEKILEYSYACQVAESLGFNEPVFHKLTPESYNRARKFLPAKSGGAITINHVHIFDFILSMDQAQRSVLISPFYTDALFGYAVTLPKQHEHSLDPFTKRIKNDNLIDEDVKDLIQIDAQFVFENFNYESNFSSLDEYKYIAERNPKFHVYLTSLYREHMETVTPYLDYSILEYMLSVPLEFRYKKKIVTVALERNFRALRNIRYVSSIVDHRSMLELLEFRMLNACNSIARRLTGGSFEFTNRFQTEEQDRILRKHFHCQLTDATQKFERMGLISSDQKKFYDTLPTRSTGISERFALISLSDLC